MFVVTSALSIFSSAFLLAFWKLAIGIYIDEKFASATFNYIPLFSLFIIVRSPEIAMHYFFNATGNPKMLVKNMMISGTVSFGLYFVMVPRFGIQGLIISQIVSVAIVYLWHLLMLQNKGFITYSTKG